MLETEFIDYIINQGVTIGMLIYFIFRFEKILNNHTKAINRLTEALVSKR